MVRETQELSDRLDMVMPPWERTLLVTHLASVVGRLADDVMATEGRLALPVEERHLARSLADVVMQAIRIANAFQVDLPQAWAALVTEGHTTLDNAEVVAAIQATLRHNLEFSSQPKVRNCRLRWKPVW